MKQNKINYIIIVFIALLGFSCEKSLEELNENPNAPEYANPDYLFTNSLIQGAGGYNTSVHVEQWGLMNWTQSLARLGGAEEGKEYEMSDEKNNLWSDLYAGSLMNASAIIDVVGDNAEQSNLKAISKIWQAYVFQRITDLWGDVPYADALLGYDEHLLTPSYDRQEAIYDGLFSQLDDAIALLDKNKESFGTTADLIYQGDVDAWTRFANSLKLRMAIRISDIAPEKAQQIIAQLEQAPMIESNSQSALFPYFDSKQNPFYAVIQRGESAGRNWPSKFLTDLLHTSADPRLPVFCQPTPQSQIFGIPAYEGVPCLAPSTSPIWDNYPEDGYNISKSGTFFLRPDMEGYFFSYAEVCFLKAEAALNGWLSGDATDWMQQGIRADMESYKLGDSSYVNQEDIDKYIQSVGEASIEKIITQKWIAFTFKNPYEAFADYRRTGYPVLTDYQGNIIDPGRFPKRLIYPASELTYNTDNYYQAVDQQGPDNQSTKLWWNQ